MNDKCVVWLLVMGHECYKYCHIVVIVYMVTSGCDHDKLDMTTQCHDMTPVLCNVIDAADITPVSVVTRYPSNIVSAPLLHSDS